MTALAPRMDVAPVYGWSDFREAIRSADLQPPEEIVADGAIHRFPSDGRRGDDAGWYVLHADGIPAGCYGCWRTGVEETWRADVGRPLTAAEKEEQRANEAAARQAREAEKSQRHAETALKAKKIWDSARTPDQDHPYLVSKRLSTKGVRQTGEKLVVPVRNSSELHSLQFISPDGSKRFLTGGGVRGCYFSIGNPKNAASLCVAEGFATGATIHEATGHPVVVAFNAGNLQPVAKTLSERYPDLPLIICGDDDAETEGNPGRTKATEAARSVGARLAFPERLDGVADFNDMAGQCGLGAVRAAVDAASICEETGTRPVPWPVPQPLSATRGEAEAYPLDALPPVIRAAVDEVHGFVKCPVVLVASSALASLSLAVQPHVDVQRAKKLTGPVSLFLLTIADSGERKSTCDGHFTEALREYEAQQAELAKPKVKDYEARKTAWDARQAGVKDKIRSCAKAGKPIGELELKLRSLADEKPVSPKVPKPLRGDDTPESLAWALSKEWPSAGVLSNEAGIVLGAHGMGKDSVMRNLALLNILWDGGVLSVGRRTSDSFTVRGARLTMALQVQELTLRTFFDRSGGLARGTGFLARFLVAWPESTQGSRMFADPPESWPAVAAFNRRIAEVLNQPTPIGDDGALNPHLLTLAPQTKRAWVTFHDAIECELRSSGELHDVRDVASKAADNAARMAALFHVFEHGTSGAVEPDAFEASSRIVAWHLNEARRFFGEMALPEELAGAARLDFWILAYCRRHRTSIVPRREIQRHVTPVSLREKVRLDAALQELVEAERVALVKDGKRRSIHVNPALLGGDKE